MTPSTPHPTERGPSVQDDASEPHEPVPLRVGGPCPACGAVIEDLDFLDLPSVAIKRKMYDVCIIETDALPTPWRHRTAVAYHEDPAPSAGRDPTPARPDGPGVD